MTRSTKLCLFLAVLATLIRSETLGKSKEEEVEVEDDGEVEVEDDESLFEENRFMSAEDAENMGQEDDDIDESSSPVVSVALTSDHMRTLHKKIDSDGNGRISLMDILNFAEMMRRSIAKQDLNSVITSMDVDKNGKVSQQEFVDDRSGDEDFNEDSRQERIKDFRDLDTNRDNQLDSDELPMYFHHYTSPKVEGVLTIIAMKDKDSDSNGVLSLQEFAAHLQHGDEPLRIPTEEREVFSKLDKDRSGTLNLDELKAWESGSFQAAEAMTDLFTGCDANGDKQITADEMEQARGRIAANHSSDAQTYLEEWRDANFGSDKKRGEL